MDAAGIGPLSNGNGNGLSSAVGLDQIKDRIVLDVVGKSSGKCVNDFRVVKGEDVWTYNVESEAMVDGRKYRVLILETD